MHDRKRFLTTAGVILTASLLASPALAEDWTAVTGQQSLTELVAGARKDVFLVDHSDIRRGPFNLPLNPCRRHHDRFHGDRFLVCSCCRRSRHRSKKKRRRPK